MSRLIVWRHGQTTWNADGKVQGHADVELTEFGRQQAEAAAERLAALGPTSIVTSDLRRAADTAAALAALTGLPVRTDPRLRERYYGPWQGLTLAEINERWPEERARWRAGVSVLGHGIETLEDLAKRSAAALSDAVAADPAGADAIVVAASHGGTARQGCASLLGWPDDVVRTLGALSNCRWTELRFSAVRGWTLWAHNVSA